MAFSEDLQHLLDLGCLLKVILFLIRKISQRDYIPLFTGLREVEAS